MPTGSKKGKRSLGRTGAKFEKARERVLAANQICQFMGNDKWPPCGKLIDLSLKYPDPMSATVDHTIPVHTLEWDDPRLYDHNLMVSMHLVCNQRKGGGRQKKLKHPTSRDWRA